MTKSKNEDAAGMSASPTAKPSYKRKRKAGEERFYAVRAGRIPGVYMTWAECQNMINGFQGAVYKAFPSREEAILFAAGKNPNPGSTPDRFYAVAVGNRPGIYTEWTEAQAAYTGVKAPKYKKFDTKEAAEEWMQTFAQANFSIGLSAEDDEDEDDEGGLPNTKKIKTDIEVNLGVHNTSGLVEVYTDGSTLANGQEGAVAGVGVFFGDGDARNISERLPGEVQTNQRAELTAILRALQTIPSTQGLLIWSDSMYAIKCVTEWFVKWENNGWKTHKGPVQNRDLVEMVLKEIRKRESLGTKTVIKWVKGHESNRGNVAADGLAVKGANDAKSSAEAAGKRKRK
ncbi:hypothetical protein N0V82_010783 [Gnomoniopsis sp. IMI 355080]|nr:hypothetical protein N0V82_010783 [Gnomoniopsis sp. IMI 355080]